MDTIELAIDGFPLDPADPDFRFHRELSNWLELANANSVPVALQYDAFSERSRWLRPALRRFAWVQAHAALIAADRKLDFRLAHLISLLVNRMSLDKPESGGESEAVFAELAAQAPAIEASGAGSMFRADTGRLLLQLVKGGVGPETRARIHALLRTLPAEDQFGSLYDLAWHLFLDENDPDDGEPCWSSAVRRELRALKPVARKPWVALLKLAPLRQAPQAGDVKWQQKVKKAVERIGREDWESRSRAWAAQAKPEAAGRPGRILLRQLAEAGKALASTPQPAPDASQLIGLLRQGSYAAFEQAVAYTEGHGYRADIVEAVRHYHATLHGSVTDQARRQHVGWWLWLEDVTPLKPEECWSSIVRADLRGFTADRKQAWMSVIRNMTFAVTNKPPAKWLKAAETAMAGVGAEEFANQVRRWLEPMAAEAPLRLTTPGRDVLRCLIWNCALCPADPRLDEALAWIAQARWKNKESRDRMLKIEGPLTEVLAARNPGLIVHWQHPAEPQSAPPDPAARMAKAMSQALASMSLGDRVEIRPDYIFVRGERDEYRIGMDGFITRRNGSAVRVNMDALPPYITQLVQPVVDAIDMAQGMFQPNQMRLFSLAAILARDAHYESAIE